MIMLLNFSGYDTTNPRDHMHVFEKNTCNQLIIKFINQNI